jgi:hypothetical protein
MSKRTVEILLSREDKAQLAQSTGCIESDAAIGRLVTWALPSEGDDEASRYAHVVIHGVDLNGERGQPELIARYYADKVQEERMERPNYVIGAVWHGDHFGFHS